MQATTAEAAAGFASGDDASDTGDAGVGVWCGWVLPSKSKCGGLQ